MTVSPCLNRAIVSSVTIMTPMSIGPSAVAVVWTRPLTEALPTT